MCILKRRDDFFMVYNEILMKSGAMFEINFIIIIIKFYNNYYKINNFIINFDQFYNNYYKFYNDYYFCESYIIFKNSNFVWLF